MEPQLREQIKNWEKALTPDEAKKLFIRNSAYESYKKDTIQETVISVTKEYVIEPITAAQMSKENVSQLIGNLEDARIALSCLTQGLQIAFAEEVEPKIKAKRLAEEKERKSSSNKPKTLEDSLNKLGIDMSKFMKSLEKEFPEAEIKKAETVSPVIEKTIIKANLPAANNIPRTTCEKCKKEILTAAFKFHKC